MNQKLKAAKKLETAILKATAEVREKIADIWQMKEALERIAGNQYINLAKPEKPWENCRCLGENKSDV